MSFFRTTNQRILSGVLFASAVLIFFSRLGTSSNIQFSTMESRDVASIVEGLVVTLKQSSSSPPTVTVNVKNTNAEPVTVLKYDSPLDSMALQLGLVTITPEGASSPLDLPRIMFRRIWPPPPDALIELAPGESAENNIVFEEHIVPAEQLGSKAAVEMKGRWSHVWSKHKADIDRESWNDATDILSGDFVAEEIVIEIK